jgi:multiple sugar transport system substrate-binding protein
MKKNVLVTLVLIMSLMLMAACGGSNSSNNGNATNGNAGKENSPKTNDEPKTLNIALWSEAVRDAVDESIKRFNEKHPNVTVNVTYSPYKDYWTKLKTGLNGGGGPDVFWMNGPNLYDYATNGLIEDVQPILDKAGIKQSDYTPAILDLYTVDGKLYGMPYFSDMMALWYNKKLFDQKNIPYPDDTWDWAKIEEVGALLTDKEQGIYGFASAPIDQEGYYNYIPQNGGFVISEDKKKSGFDAPETIEALEWMYKQMQDGISPTAQQQVETELLQMVYSGKIAIYPALSVKAQRLYDALGDDLAVTVLPKGKQRATVVHGISWSINPNAKETELVHDLALELSGKEAQRQLGESGYGIPTFVGEQQVWADSIPQLKMHPLLDSMLNDGVAYPVSKNGAEWLKVQGEELQKAFFGQQTMEEAGEKIAEKMNEILAKN